MLQIREVGIDHQDAIELMAQLSDQLERITGNSGTGSFHKEDMNKERSIFVVAYLEGKPVGCGAIREHSYKIAEMKRIYTKRPGHGVGSEIVRVLEEKARQFGYTQIILETRKVNQTAVSFYQNRGYQIRKNYGIYSGREDAVCFEKHL